MKQWKRIIAMVAFAALVGFWSGAPANAQTLEFYQLDFDLDGTITENSDWGMVDLTFTGYTDIVYFNLTINGSWQIQNVPLLSIEGAGVTQTQTLGFDLGNDVGENVTSLNYAYQLTPDTLAGPPSGSIPASVGDRWIVLYSGEIAGPPGRQEPPPAGPMENGEAEGPGCKKEGVPNQECGKNECVPAAISNSLKYLKDKFGLTMPPNDIETMKGATGWTPDGCPWYGPNWADLKDEYMKTHGYPISTKKFDRNEIDKVFDELCRCQDVEMRIEWLGNDGNKRGHAVTVVGMTKLKKGKWSIDFNDDGAQGKPGGLRTRGKSTFDPTTGKFEDGGEFAGKRLTHFVVECPIFECHYPIHKDTPGTAIDLHVIYEGAQGSIRDVVVTNNPPGCESPTILIIGGNEVHFRWPDACVDSCEWMEYKFTVDYPCESVYPISIEWTYPPQYPTLSQWVLIVLALSVAGFFVWQLKRRRKKAVASV